MRLIEATFPDENTQKVVKAVVRADPVHWRMDQPGQDGLRALHALFDDGGQSQAFIDALQGILGDGQSASATKTKPKSDDPGKPGLVGPDLPANGSDTKPKWRVVVMPVEATVPALPATKDKPKADDEKKRKRTMALREEIYQDVAKGADLNTDYLVLTALSTVVAAIGLNADNVAVVIGAMVIAPLLGPVLALNFASALGDTALLLRAARTASAGLALGFSVSVLIGLTTTVQLESVELSSRTVVGLDSVALALASGAAAALSIVTGLSMTLVGVMVAVALLPPTAAIGLYLGAGEPTLALKATLLLIVNVVCVNIAALVVYRWKGVAPRTWLERKSAKRSATVNLVVWTTLLAILVGVIVFAQTALPASLP